MKAKQGEKILIGLPAYNEGKVIEKFLDELLEEKKKFSFDILVVNDGSVDDTLKKVKKKKC